MTLLTSLTQEELNEELRSPMPVTEYVVGLARLACASGAHGAVCSPWEIEPIRGACGPDFLIVTPGVRPAGTPGNDQRRTLTPGEAVRRGADYLVLGRAITAAPDPIEAADRIVSEIATACA